MLQNCIVILCIEQSGFCYYVLFYFQVYFVLRDCPGQIIEEAVLMEKGDMN